MLEYSLKKLGYETQATAGRQTLEDGETVPPQPPALRHSPQSEEIQLVVLHIMARPEWSPEDELFRMR